VRKIGRGFPAFFFGAAGGDGAGWVGINTGAIHSCFVATREVFARDGDKNRALAVSTALLEHSILLI